MSESYRHLCENGCKALIASNVEETEHWCLKCGWIVRTEEENGTPRGGPLDKECPHEVLNLETGFHRSLLVLNDAYGDADSTQLYYGCSHCDAEFVITLNVLTMKVIKPMKKNETGRRWI